MIRTWACVVSAVILLVGCAPTSTQPKREIITPRYEVEKEPIEDQANSAINAAPTTFSVISEAENTLYWDRASLFFKQYTDTFKVKKDLVRSVPGEKTRFVYEVSRVNKPDATSYTVKCAPGGGVNTSTDVLLRNAKNLARFIREGNLELSLLER